MELLRVENVSKKLCKNLQLSLRYGISDVAKSLFGLTPAASLRAGEFWALKDVSFDLKKGECLALLGRNGAGKSTLLRLIAGIMQADKGTVNLRGSAQGIIALGAGFDPYLTGRENVFVNGALLGFTTKEVDSIYNEIVSFSELEDFMNIKVRVWRCAWVMLSQHRCNRIFCWWTKCWRWATRLLKKNASTASKRTWKSGQSSSWRTSLIY